MRLYEVWDTYYHKGDTPEVVFAGTEKEAKEYVSRDPERYYYELENQDRHDPY